MPGRVVLIVRDLPLNPDDAKLIQRSFDFGGNVVNGKYFALREQIHASCLSWIDLRFQKRVPGFGFRVQGSGFPVEVCGKGCAIRFRNRCWDFNPRQVAGKTGSREPGP
jgi:hypothetical protein